MFATIRRYAATTSIPQKDIDEFRHLISDGFLPMVKDIEGFHAYHVFVTDKELCTVSVFETRTGAAESTKRAAEFVRKTPLPLVVVDRVACSGRESVMPAAPDAGAGWE